MAAPSPDERAQWKRDVMRGLEDNGLSQKKAALKLGYQAASVSRVLDGKQNNSELARALCELAGIPVPAWLSPVAEEDHEWVELGRNLRASDPEMYRDLVDRIAKYLESRQELRP